jgi:hypothetical protein
MENAMKVKMPKPRKPRSGMDTPKRKKTRRKK